METETVDRLSNAMGDGALERPGGRMEDLFKTHSPAALRFAYLLTGDEELARDVTQDAFVRVFGRFKDRAAPDRFENYLRRTIANLCKDRWRRKHRARALEQRLEAPTDRVEPPAVETADELWEALNELPARQRAVLVLRYYEDMSEHETAAVLGCSVGAVKGLVTRGTEAMRKHLGGDDR